uniref:Clip-associating protein 1 n=1 Tax=Heterorhabditis bacteriophora TaxID=37862 RepID=A0A1I7X6H7_HETBA
MMLIQNSAKVMATSGILTCQFIIKVKINVFNCLFYQLLFYFRQTQDLIYQMLSIWTESKLERSMTAIVESIKLGISDADPQARAAARNGYQQLEMHYPQQAQFLYQVFCTITITLRNFLKANASLTVLIKEIPAFFSGRSASEIDSGSVRRAAAYTPVKSRLVGTTAARNSPVRPTPSRSGLPPTRQTPLKTSNSVNPPGSLSQRIVFHVLAGSRSTSPTRFSTNRRVAASGMTTSSRILTSIPKNSMGREQSPRRYSSGRSSNGFSNGSVQQDMQRAVFNAIKNFSMNADDDEEFLLGGILKFDQADLTDAIRSCTSSNLNEKKEGLRALLEILRSGRSLPSSDIKKVCDTINKLLTEGNHKLMSNVLDILAVFVKSHHDSLTEWLQILLVRLLQKSGMEILPTVQNQLSSALQAVRLAFRADLQLTALCKYIQDPIHTPPVKVKGATLNYLNELLHIMDPGTELNRGEVRGAVYKIFQWMEDPKNNSIRMACERVIYGLFSLNTADFSSVLATFPPAWKEFAFGLLKKNGSGVDAAVFRMYDFIALTKRGPMRRIIMY